MALHGLHPRHRIDIEPDALGRALARCARPSRDAARALEAWASPDGEVLATLSVRSGFDALLTALALPAGSEVLLSGWTIPDMARVVRAHGLVPVPLDCEAATLAPTTVPTPAPKKNGAPDLVKFWLASDQTRLAGSACHERPWPCLQQLVIGTLAIGAAWTAIAWYVDAKPPNARHLLKFWAIYLPVAFFLRWMDVEIQDKLAIAAGMTIGNKMVQILTAA